MLSIFCLFIQFLKDKFAAFAVEWQQCHLALITGSRGKPAQIHPIANTVNTKSSFNRKSNATAHTQKQASD